MLAATSVAWALRHLGASAATVAFVTGAGGSTSSLATSALVVYMFYALAVRAVYYAGGGAMQAAVERLAPRSGTARAPIALRRQHRRESEVAFQMYSCVGFLNEWLHARGLSRACFSLAECGGPAHALAWTVVWFVLFELGVFLVHWGLLHRLPFGKTAFNVRARARMHAPRAPRSARARGVTRPSAQAR
mgnify:CR=1 FL=1